MHVYCEQQFLVVYNMSLIYIHRPLFLYNIRV